MSTTTEKTTADVITIKQVPHDLKIFWHEQAKMNSRSMNKEIIRPMQQERVRLLSQASVRKDTQQIDDIVRTMHCLSTLDARPMNGILYDENGMPRLSEQALLLPLSTPRY